MTARPMTFSFEFNDYKGQDARDVFGRRVFGDYIVEWSPTDEELDVMDASRIAAPSWEYMGQLAMDSIEPRHRKSKYEYLLEKHHEDDGINAPMYGVSVSVIDRKSF